jgi:hypothetical protein
MEVHITGVSEAVKKVKVGIYAMVFVEAHFRHSGMPLAGIQVLSCPWTPAKNLPG